MLNVPAVQLDSQALQAWQRLDTAAKAILVAQPAGMSEAAAELAAARRDFEDLILRAMNDHLGVQRER